MENEIHKYSKLEQRKNRRKAINLAMSKLIDSGKDCMSCVGHCCTFEHNSMQVTPLEALDVYNYLSEKGLLGSELIAKLEQNIKHFRLDREPLLVGSKSLRRYYTCPFYEGQALGCSIDRESKPYGCLAFNPLTEKVSTAGFCQSSGEVLKVQQLEFGTKEERQIEEIKGELGIYWSKKNLPSALLYLIKAFRNMSENE